MVESIGEERRRARRKERTALEQTAEYWAESNLRDGSIDEVKVIECRTLEMYFIHQRLQITIGSETD